MKAFGGSRPPRIPELESTLLLREEAGAFCRAPNPPRWRTVGAPPPPRPSPRRRGHFRRALRVPFLLGAQPAAVPSRSRWPVPFVGPLLLLGLASSGTSHYPLHGARYCPHMTEPLHFHLCSGPWLVPACLFPPHASAQPGFSGGGRSCGGPGTEALLGVWGRFSCPRRVGAGGVEHPAGLSPACRGSGWTPGGSSGPR